MRAVDSGFRLSSSNAGIPKIYPARIIAPGRRQCRVLLADGSEQAAVLRGKLFHGQDGNAVVVGDQVMVEEEGGTWSVDAVTPRRNEFVRQGLRKDRQVMFANVERVLIIASLASPVTKIATIDRFLVAALRGKIEPVLVLTKTDLDEQSKRERELRDLYEIFHCRVYPVSNETGSGQAALGAEIARGITAMVGNSGVGKSTLMNAVIPGLDLETREVSAWSGKGTHTTTAALLVPFGENAALIDTPGMKSFVPHGIDRNNLLELFPDLRELADDCRFNNCGHSTEPQCAIRDAVESGQIAASRFSSYRRLLEDMG
jgi:ribosome biogenesis GTPase